MTILDGLGIFFFSMNEWSLERNMKPLESCYQPEFIFTFFTLEGKISYGDNTFTLSNCIYLFGAGESDCWSDLGAYDNFFEIETPHGGGILTEDF